MANSRYSEPSVSVIMPIAVRAATPSATSAAISIQAPLPMCAPAPLRREADKASFPYFVLYRTSAGPEPHRHICSRYTHIGSQWAGPLMYRVGYLRQPVSKGGVLLLCLSISGGKGLVRGQGRRF